MRARRRAAAPLAVLLGLALLMAGPRDVATQPPPAGPDALGLPGTRWTRSTVDGVQRFEWDGVALVEGAGRFLLSSSDAHELVRRLEDRNAVDIVVDRSTLRDCDAASPEPVAVASVIKLVVTAAALEAIDQHRLSFEDKLTLRPELRSHPAGVLQEGADGLQVSVERALNLMLAVSDNTAMDLLLERVGREAVSATLRRQEDGELDARQVPLLSTREAFMLKFGPDSTQASRFEVADDDGQAEILGSIRAEPLPAIDARVAPSHVDTIGHFASPAALCRTWRQLACGPHWRKVSSWLNRVPMGALAPSATIVEKEGYEPGLHVTSVFSASSTDYCSGSSAAAFLQLRTGGSRERPDDPSIVARTLGRLIAAAGPDTVRAR
jgi:beta-lactamase family protein